MKKITKIILLVLTLAILAAVPFAVSASESEPSLTIKAANLSFEDEVYPIFAISGEGVDLEGVRLLVWTSARDGVNSYVKGTESAVIDSYGDDTVSGVFCKKFKYTELYAHNMADAIYVRAYAVVDGEEVYSGLTKYSILRYAYNKMGLTGTASSNADFRAMLSSMLGYGADAQKYCGYKTDRLATDSFHKITVDGGLLADGTPSGLYLEGDSITVTAPETDADGRPFAAWVNSAGEELATTATATVSVGSAHDTYTATYEEATAPDESVGTEGLLYYLNSDDTYSVSGYEGTASDVVIPQTHEGKPVTAIDWSAFKDRTHVTSVLIPDSVTSIVESAFSGCSGLRRIVIPDSVTHIDKTAFQNCWNLMSVTIGEGVRSIESNAFFGCYKLVEVINRSSLNIVVGATGNGRVANYAVEVHSRDSGIVNEDGYLFYSCDGDSYLLGYVGDDTDLILPSDHNGDDYAVHDYAFYEGSAITSVVIPDGVTSIGANSFCKCENLASAVIGDGVTDIGNFAFARCTALASVEIGDGVRSIGQYAFQYCSSLVSVLVPDGVESIGYNSFALCSSLESITLPFVGREKDSVTNTHFGYIFGASSYSKNKSSVPASLKTVVITGDGKIDSYAFYGCSGIESIGLSAGVKSIGNYVFSDCTSLTVISFCGTESQWKDIPKGTDWDANVGDYTVIYEKEEQ